MRPAGMSSDDDSDYDGFMFDRPPKKTIHFYEKQLDNKDEFLSAAQQLDLEKMKRLFAEGVDINYKPTNTWNAILYVANLGNKEILSWLIENGADIKSSHEKVTPLLALCDSSAQDELQLYECLDILLQKGANPHDRDWFQVPAISKAVKRNHKKLVIRLISEGCDVNIPDVDGWTPIFYAVDTGNKDMVDFLKDSGAYLYHTDKRGRSLLDFAVSKENSDIVEMLGGCQYTEGDENGCITQIYQSSYQEMASQLPKRFNRLSGFKREVNHILVSVGLQCLTHLFEKNDVQFGELMTITDERLKEIGVQFWFDRIRIRFAAKEFLQYPWHISSFGSNFTNKQMSVFQVADTLATIMRQLVVLNVTVYRWKEEGNPKDSEQLRTMLKSCRELTKIMKAINKRAVILDKNMNPVSCDLIVPEKGPTFKWKKVLGLLTITGFLLVPVVRSKILPS